MKKFLIAAAAAVLLLFVIDKMLLQQEADTEKTKQSAKYEKIENPEQLPIGLEAGNRAPNFTLTDLKGNKITLEDYRGKRVLINFWATWCPPCKKEMPYMQILYEKYKDQDFEILAVNSTVTEKSREDVVRFVKEYGLTFTVPMDEKNQVSSRYEVLTYPSSVFLDSDGVIRSRIAGAMNKDFIEEEIKRLP